MEREPKAFMSYTRFDDQNDGRRLTMFRDRLSNEVRAQTGKEFLIFQDIEDIKWGQDFAKRIEDAIKEVTFLIPIITPSFLSSEYCREELRQFLKREEQLQRNDLILPVYYITYPILEDRSKRATDELAQIIAARQYVDWRDLRFESFDSQKVRRRLASMAVQIRAAIERVQPSLASDTSGSLPDTVLVLAGRFLMGSAEGDEWASGNERPQHTVELSVYRIGRYPLTNADYTRFLRAGGYANPDYWTTAGWRWREENGVTQPEYWEDEKWNRLDHPVVGVSWYEAVAYCRWLTEALRSAGALDEGEVVRLPTEAEWEKAARGEHARRWPWGDEFNLARANTREDGPGRTTPVGKYSPAGDSPYGAADMAGNVWEWCSSIYRGYPYDPGDGREDWEAEGLRVLRGSSWPTSHKLARCAYRYRRDPWIRLNDVGFRCVMGSP